MLLICHFQYISGMVSSCESAVILKATTAVNRLLSAVPRLFIAPIPRVHQLGLTPIRTRAVRVTARRPSRGGPGCSAGRTFRRFYIGQATSLLGTSMSAVAVSFAVLDDGGSAADVGYVIAARILPQVVLVLGGGVLAVHPGRPLA